MEKEEKKKLTPGEELFSWAQSLIWALLLLVFISAFLVRISGVSGDSMYPTLHDGDRILVRVASYEQPQRGDMIVVQARHYLSEPLVKRVIAVAGDTVEVEYGGVVYVNGEEIDEPYVNEEVFGGGDTQYPITVPEGSVFVMGDNRNNSEDSRLTAVGTLKTEDIIGKVIFRIFPFNRIGGVYR